MIGTLVRLALTPSALVADLYATAILGKADTYECMPRPTPPEFEVHVPATFDAQAVAITLSNRMKRGQW